jgi:hypothetical protein
MIPSRTIFTVDDPRRWNKKQTKVLLAGLSAVAISLLFPPWLYFNNNTSGQKSAGYHFFRSPPTITDPEKIFDLSYEQRWDDPEEEIPRRRSFSVKLNGIRLFVQVSFLLFLTYGLFEVWGRTDAGCGAAVGFAGAGLLFALLLFLAFFMRF